MQTGSPGVLVSVGVDVEDVVEGEVEERARFMMREET